MFLPSRPSNKIFHQPVAYIYITIPGIFLNIPKYSRIFRKRLLSGTVEPHYKEVGYNKPSSNKVILLVPALYISLFCVPDITRNSLIKQGNFHGPKVLVIMRFHCTVRAPVFSTLNSVSVGTGMEV